LRGGGTAHFLLGLIEPTDALHELLPRCLGISHRPVLCLGILYGPDLSLLLHGPSLSLFLHGPDLCSDILCGLCLGILCGLYGPDLCPCIFLGRPSLESI